ncbi:MAG: SurA N-terminal domain-containing protein, partial [Candidatus Liptonbacteria bacterium]
MKFKDLLANKKYLFPSIAVLIVMVLCIIWLFSETYTVATVNGSAISAGDFYENYRAASHYYSALKNKYASASVSVNASSSRQIKELSDKEIKADVLSSLIEVKLVEQKA